MREAANHKPSESTIDHILVSDQNKISQHGAISIGFSDHQLIYCTCKITREHLGHQKTVHVRSMKHYSKELLVQNLMNVNWDNVLSCHNVQKVWYLFENLVMSVINKIAPYRQCRVKFRTQTWMCNEIYEEYLKKFHASRKQVDYKNYCKSRNETQRMVKKAKQNFIMNKIEQNKDNPKKIWDSLKLLGYNAKPKTKSQIVLNISNNTCHDPVSIAEHINVFFTNIGNNLVLKLHTDKFSAFTNYCQKFYKKLGTNPGQLIHPSGSRFKLYYKRITKPKTKQKYQT